jgi:hypothetical protein
MWQPKIFRRRSSSKRIAKTARTQRLSAERLEDRSMFSATFGSALSIGNEFNSSVATDVATDSAGSSYVSGMFAGTVDFDLGNVHSGDADILTSRGSGDAYVAKYAPDNSVIWVRSMGGDAVSSGLTDVAREISIDTNGAVYLSGEFLGSADFGSTTLSSVGQDDGFVAKLDAGGAVQWARRWGTAGNDGARGVDVDADGNVYAMGSRLGDAYDILKFGPTGAPIWSKTIFNRSMLSSADLAVNAAGNVYVAGSFDGTVDFDPSAKTKYVSSGAERAGFVLKLDTNGQFGWVSPFVGKRVGSTNSASGAMSVALDGSGNIIVGGTFNGTVDFNPGSGTTNLATTSGGFITKLNTSGGLVWARALHGNTSTFVNGLSVDAAGSIYAAGTFHGTVDLDPGAGVRSRTTAGDGDIFVLKLTSTGNHAWSATFGGTGNDVGFAVDVDADGTVHLAGYYRNTVDFDPDPFATYDLTSSGTLSHGFRLRLRQA